jgi:RNA polymerase sigma-70 factor, ECF subfamily
MGELSTTLEQPLEPPLEQPLLMVPEDVMSVEDLFSAHHVRVFQAAYRVSGNVQDAEDAMQSVFLGMLKSGEVAGMQNPGSYLCRSVINRSLDQLRARQRKATDVSESAPEEVVDSMNPVDGSVRHEELRQHLRLALGELNPRAAEVFSLRHFEEFSNAEIAELLNTSPSSIAVTLHRARQQLQARLRAFEGGNDD